MPDHEYSESIQKQKHQAPSFSRAIKPVLGYFSRKLKPNYRNGSPRLQSTSSSIHDNNTVLLPEIWIDIFHHLCSNALEEQFSVTSRYGRTRQKMPHTKSKLHLTPVLLSQVCRHWNVMITSDPLFWNIISVNPCSQSSELHLRTWLDRSQSVPVSIYFEANSFDADNNWRVDNCDISPLKACIKIIHQHSWHIESLSVRLFKRFLNIWTNMLERSSEEGLPTLHSLGSLVIEYLLHSSERYTSTRDDNVIEQRFIAALTSQNPSITSLTLQDCDIYANLPIFAAQMPSSPTISGLVSLTLKELGIRQVPLFVRNLAHTRLRVLWLVAVSFHQSDREEKIVRTRLPSIQELHLQIVGRQFPETNRTPNTTMGVSSFAQRVILPNLVTLEVDLNVNGWDSILRYCTIRRLTIWDTLSFGRTAWNLLSSQACSELEELTLKPHIWMHHDMIRLLDGSYRAFGYQHDDQPSYITPMFSLTLKRLVLHGCVVDHVDGLLAQVAQSRMQNCGLEYLYVEVKGLHPERNFKDIQAFKELRRLGYKTYLQGTPQSVIQRTDDFMTEKAYDFLGYLDIPSFKRELEEIL